MADKRDIEKNINLIFEVEERNIKNNKIFHYVQTFREEYLTKKNPEKSRVSTYSSLPLIPLSDLELNPNDVFRLQWETYTSLKKLYNKIEHFPGCRNLFLNIMGKKLSKIHSILAPVDASLPMNVSNTNLHGNASLAFYFLLNTGNCDAIISALETKLNENMVLDTVEDLNTGEYVEVEIYTCENDMVGLFRDVLMFMHFEPAWFNEPLLDLLSRTAYNCFPVSLDLREKFLDEILLLKYSRLKSYLEASNEELNIHKEQTIGIISKYGFPSKMERFLLEIDRLPELSNWQSINSGMIANLRYFFEELIKSIAEKIFSKTGNEYQKDPNKSELGIKRAYIKEHLALSQKDNKLIDSFVDILHKEGGHAFTSEKRYFIMTKNIGIEIAYFLLSTYEEKFEKPIILYDKSIG